MRGVLWLAGTAIGSLAFQISVVIWPQKFAQYAWLVKYLWMTWFVFLFSYVITSEKVLGRKLKKLWGVEDRQEPASQSVPPLTVPPVVQTQTASPHIEQHVHLGPQKQEEPKPKPLKLEPKPQPNLVLNQVLTRMLYLRHDHWSMEQPKSDWSRTIGCKAWLAEIKNRRSDERKVGPAQGIRAELIVDENEYAPLSWVDSEFNLVNLEFGAVKYIVLAVEMETNLRGDWRVPINHKDYNYGAGRSGIDVDNAMAKGKSSTLKLNLLHVEGGTTLSSFDGACEWQKEMLFMNFPS